MHLLNRAFRVTDKARKIATSLEIDRSCLRQTYVVGGSVKELHPQPLLQILHFLLIRALDVLKLSAAAVKLPRSTTSTKASVSLMSRSIYRGPQVAWIGGNTSPPAMAR